MKSILRRLFVTCLIIAAFSGALLIVSPPRTLAFAAVFCLGGTATVITMAITWATALGRAGNWLLDYVDWDN